MEVSRSPLDSNEYNAEILARMPLCDVETAFRNGHIGADSWNAYLFVWKKWNIQDERWCAYKQPLATERSARIAELIDAVVERRQGISPRCRLPTG